MWLGVIIVCYVVLVLDEMEVNNWIGVILIAAPHLTGFMLKLFVKLVEAPGIGAFILNQMKKQNKINEV